MGGELKCTAEDTSKCKLSVLLKDTDTGNFVASYNAEEGLQQIADDTRQREINATVSGEAGRRLRVRSLQSTDQQVLNPVVCIEKGGALLFGQVSADNYPVYQKNSLLNSDPDFDYSAFL